MLSAGTLACQAPALMTGLFGTPEMRRIRAQMRCRGENGVQQM
jgi:hypothetical protein